MSAVDGVKRKYWKRVGSPIEVMSLAEGQAVDAIEAAEKEALIQSLDDLSASALAKSLVRAGLIAKVDLVTAIKEVLNG